jgi:flagellar protein FlaI
MAAHKKEVKGTKAGLKVARAMHSRAMHAHTLHAHAAHAQHSSALPHAKHQHATHAAQPHTANAAPAHAAHPAHAQAGHASHKGAAHEPGKEAEGKEEAKTDVPQPPKLAPPGKVQHIKLIDQYVFTSKNIPITIKIYTQKGWFVPLYEVFISSISPATEFVLEKIREELIREVSLGIVDIMAAKQAEPLEKKFEHAISILIDKYFPGVQPNVKEFFVTYLIQRSLGLGNIDILMSDVNIEEIAINSSDEPIWIYHKRHGWLRTNIKLKNEDQTRHYATMMARRVGRQISVLEPLLDAHLVDGNRVNATLMPISSRGNTITLRMFSKDPWTITKFVKSKTISLQGAALIWLAVQYELSLLIAGGTASGKTSMLNVITNFFPPNQRIISIEDTREIQLPKYLHWVPMSTRLPNAEGKGGLTMLDLLVNSLRMRPDRIVVGEVRRKREAEVLFEAIHTGHSVYATFHANNAKEAITRLINPPIEVPKTMIPAISLVVIQFRNRRTGLRRTFQLAEITEEGDPNVLMQFDPKKDFLQNVGKSKTLMNTLQTYTGYTTNEIRKILEEKEKVLKYLINHNVESVDEVGQAMAEYYTNHEEFMHFVNSNKLFGGLNR